MIHWNAVDATYPSLPDPGDSLMQANSPWSGAYHVGKQLWTVAHTTQFTQPGWQYLDSATGYLGGSRNNGSFPSACRARSQASASSLRLSILAKAPAATPSPPIRSARALSMDCSNGIGT